MKRIPVFVLILVMFFIVGASTVSAKTWSVPRDFTAIQAAIDDPNVQDGDKIMVGPGTFAGATVSKAVKIQAKGFTIINDGPLPWGTARPFAAGFFFPGNGVGSGASIRDFQFQDVEFPIFSRGANDVTVDGCKIANAIQAVTDWHGQRWQVTDNRIVDLQSSNGGGIGILVGGVSQNWQGDIVGNFIAGNTIQGTLHVMPGDGGGYNGSGIVLYADFRWGAQGANSIAYNQVTKNIVRIESDNPSLVDIAAVELTDTRDDPNIEPIIFNNFIGFNDLRGTSLQLDLTPDNLDEVNWIFKNSGEKRGHGFRHHHRFPFD